MSSRAPVVIQLLLACPVIYIQNAIVIPSLYESLSSRHCRRYSIGTQPAHHQADPQLRDPVSQGVDLPKYTKAATSLPCPNLILISSTPPTPLPGLASQIYRWTTYLLYNHSQKSCSSLPSSFCLSWHLPTLPPLPMVCSIDLLLYSHMWSVLHPLSRYFSYSAASFTAIRAHANFHRSP